MVILDFMQFMQIITLKDLEDGLSSKNGICFATKKKKYTAKVNCGILKQHVDDPYRPALLPVYE